VAEALWSSIDNAKPEAGEISRPVSFWPDACLRISADRQWFIELHGREFVLPVEVGAALLSEIGFLEETDTQIDHHDGIHVLRDAKTHVGHVVDSDHFGVIRAIACECVIRGVLDATDFGIYSAYCTLRDFSASREISLSICDEALDIQFEYFDPETMPTDLLGPIKAAQLEIMGEELWGRGRRERHEGDGALFAEGMKKLSPVQRTQFVLLSGMYNCGFPVVLATVLGHLTFERYASLKCEGLQSDSDEEQETRTHISLIQLLGMVAGHDSLPSHWH
jgi:hypothetical protein